MRKLILRIFDFTFLRLIVDLRLSIIKSVDSVGKYSRDNSNRLDESYKYTNKIVRLTQNFKMPKIRRN